MREKFHEAKAALAEVRQELRAIRREGCQPPPRDPELETLLDEAIVACAAFPPLAPPGIGETVRQVSRVASRLDGMMKKDNPSHYVAVGISALAAMHQAVPRIFEEGQPKRILDFGCGFGRVARFLAAQWPKADLMVCDVDFSGVAFCAAHLGLPSFRIDTDPSVNRLGAGYDLIWVGSVITHLDAEPIRKHIETLGRALAPGGYLCATSHGDFPAGRFKQGDPAYGIPPEAARRMAESYEMTGFGYADYPKTPGYGVSLTSASWLESTCREFSALEWVGHWPNIWDNHQDLLVCRRV